MQKMNDALSLKARGFSQSHLTAAFGSVLHMHIERSQMKFGLSCCSAEGFI